MVMVYLLGVILILDYNHEGVTPKAQLRRCDIRDFIYYRCDILTGNISV